MILIEKIKPVGINTDISPLAVELGNDGNRSIINPVIDGLNKHYYTSESGSSLRAENVKGNVLKSNSLPSGSNVCIGTYEDQLNNRLVFWNYNSNGDHGVYAYSPETDSIVTLIQILGLNFQNDRRYLITGVGSIGQLLYWSDGFNPQRVINMQRDYSSSFVEDITLIRPVPIIPPILAQDTFYGLQHPEYARVDDGDIINKITDKNIQFSYRYKYLDNEYSVIAPYSDLSYADFDPDFFNKTKTNVVDGEFVYNYKNTISVFVNGGFDNVNVAIVKQVEFLYRENNTGNWRIWKIFNSAGVLSAVFDLKNANLIDVDITSTSKLFEAVPNFSKALCLHKNRVFVTADEENFDVLDSPTITITPRYTKDSSHDVWNGSLTIASNQSFITPFVTSFVVGDRVMFYTSDALPGFASGGFFLGGNVISITAGVATIRIDAAYTALVGTYTRNWELIRVMPNPFKTYWKNNAVHLFGIAVFDYQLRCMGVVSPTKLTIANDFTKRDSRPLGGEIEHYGSYNNRTLDFDVSGNFSTSPKVRFISLCVTEDQFYQTYHQSNVRPYFYKYDNVTGYSVAGTEVLINGRIFTKAKPALQADFSQIWLQIPKDFAVTLDTTFYVRPVGIDNYIKANSLPITTNIEKIQNIIGDYVVINNFGITDWSSLPSSFAVEFFVPKDAPSNNVFYEIGKRIEVNADGTFTFPSIKDLQGPTYLYSKGANILYSGAFFSDALYKTNGESQFYFQQTYNTHSPETTYVSAIDGRGGFPGVTKLQQNADSLLFAESPTPTTTLVNTQNVENANVYPSQPSVFSNVKIIVSDYTKVARSQGKTIADVLDKKAFPRTSVIRFSNTYVQDTNINGLSSFDSGNQYSLPYERGAITKILTVGNRLLIVHEFNSTVVYTNENVITKSDGSQDLIASSDVVAYNRALQDGGYGSYHPESVVYIEGNVFGFDIYAGAVWRYTNEGQFPISNYGRKEYFRTKSELYLPNKDGVKIIGGHDPFNKEYLLTFNDGTGASETIAFNYEKDKWTIRYAFIPEFYGKINNKLVSFKNGQFWVHNENSIYNNFYGVQYTSFLKLAVNPHPGWSKDFMGIDLAMESISSDVDFKQVELFTEEGQYSYLKSDEFEKKENTFYANILKDVNTLIELLTFNTINIAPVLSSGSNDASVGTAAWTISSNPSVNLLNTALFYASNRYKLPVSGLAGIAYKINYSFTITNGFTKAFDFTIELILSGVVVYTALVSVEGNGTFSDIINVPSPSNFDSICVRVKNEDDGSGLGSAHIVIDSLVVYATISLRQGDDMRSKYLLLQVNDDSTNKNSMQFINLAYVKSEYTE